MISNKLKSMNTNQQGFTLIELLIAVAITALIIGGVVLAIFQVFSVNTRSGNHMTAVNQVQNAGSWINHDVQMAQTIDTTDDPATTDETEKLTLTWVRWPREDGKYVDSYKVRHTWNNLEVWRHQEITTQEYDSDGQPVGDPIVTQNSTLIADYITTLLPTLLLVDNNMFVTVTIGARVGVVGAGAADVERTYEIVPRVIIV